MSTEKNTIVTPTNGDTERRPSKKSRLSRRMRAILLFVLIIALISAIIVLFLKYREANDNNPANQQKALTEELSKVVVIPSEEPVISTVLDKSKLTNPALATRARNGDTLFIFPQSKRLILYRSSDNKIVDMLNIQP